MTDLKTIVVLGGTGNFGRRICKRLFGEANVTLVVTSRDESRVGGLVAELQGQNPIVQIKGICLDQLSLSFEQDLANLNPDIVLHTAGPYQGQNYRVANACISCGSHYIDLADGREFVEGFGQLNELAKAKDVLLVCGASTLPGLSSAVVDSLRDRFSEIHQIEISIAPAHQTPRGYSTVAAVLSYCGREFDVLENGVWVTHFGWQNIKLQKYPTLGTRLSAVCDVPDLGLFPKLIPSVRTVTFHAALEAKWEQISLWMMAWLIRLGVVRDWSRLIKTFMAISDRLIHFGSDTGGMHVRLTGHDLHGQNKSCAWYLTARSNHGPEIPCSPALVLTRKLIRGDIDVRGAYACVGMMTLEDFADEASELDISWMVQE